MERPVDEIQEEQENKEVEDETKETDDKKDNIEEIEYISDKSLEDEQEQDVERDALTVATTALESNIDTADQKSIEDDAAKLDKYEKEY